MAQRELVEVGVRGGEWKNFIFDYFTVLSEPFFPRFPFFIIIMVTHNKKRDFHIKPTFIQCLLPFFPSLPNIRSVTYWRSKENHLLFFF